MLKLVDLPSQNQQNLVSIHHGRPVKQKLFTPIRKGFFLFFKATVETFPGAYLIIVASLALLNSALLFTVRWGLTKVVYSLVV